MVHRTVRLVVRQNFVQKLFFQKPRDLAFDCSNLVKRGLAAIPFAKPLLRECAHGHAVALGGAITL
jgi:hypothetical protein